MGDDDSLKALRQRIDKAQGSARPDARDSASSSQGVGFAMRLAVELMAGVAVGSLVGYGLDHWLGTMPVFFILCFFLGTAAGFRNLWREAQKISTEKDD